ncbi:unnamed protein product [Tilletia controversa]|nr:unnamed protein product [Tilletia controversa]
MPIQPREAGASVDLTCSDQHGSTTQHRHEASIPLGPVEGTMSPVFGREVGGAARSTFRHPEARRAPWEIWTDYWIMGQGWIRISLFRASYELQAQSRVYGSDARPTDRGRRRDAFERDIPHLSFLELVIDSTTAASVSTAYTCHTAFCESATESIYTSSVPFKYMEAGCWPGTQVRDVFDESEGLEGLFPVKDTKHPIPYSPVSDSPCSVPALSTCSSALAVVLSLPLSDSSFDLLERFIPAATAQNADYNSRAAQGGSFVRVLLFGVSLTSAIKDLVCVPLPRSPPVVRLSARIHHLDYGNPLDALGACPQVLRCTAISILGVTKHFCIHQVTNEPSASACPTI